MKKQIHNSYTTAGLVITYVVIALKIIFIILFASILFLGSLDMTDPLDLMFIKIWNTTSIILVIIHLFFLGLTVAFHRNKIKSYIIIGVITLLLSSVIGGIFILIGGYLQNKDDPELNTQNDFISIETKLKNLEKLFENGTITKDEYELKRKEIIDTL